MFYDIFYYFLLFMIYSFIGWIIEIITIYVSTKKVVNRGFLIGPYCPVYGFGALILTFIFSNYEHDPINLFVIFIVYASILEYFTGYLLEKLFNARWWDYSKNKFNLNGRVCLSNSLGFGILGLLLGYVINPFVTGKLSFMPTEFIYFIGAIIMTLFVVDVIITFNIISRIRHNIVLLNKDMTEDINKQMVKFITNNRFVKAFPLLKQKFVRLINKAFE